MALTDNLVAFWELEESSGSRADAAGSNTLTSNNTVGSNTGKVGTCAEFSRASTQYLSIADNAALSMGDIDFTIAGWFKLKTMANDQYIVSKSNFSVQFEYSFYFDQPSQHWAFYVSPNGAATTTVTWASSPSANTFYYIVLAHDSVNNIISIQVNNGTAVTAAHTTGVVNGTQSFLIGCLFLSGSPFDPFDGMVDQLGVWKRILTAGEITSLYNSGNGLAYSGMVTASPRRNVLSGQAVTRASFY